MNTAPLARTGLHPGVLLGTLALGAVLIAVAFVGVVREAVRQADTGRRAVALLDEAHWRCRALKLPRQREECLRLFGEARPGDSATLQLLVSAAAAAPVAPFGPTR
ncbi:MAG: hypothetical protein JNN03_04465 [Rubrivivax sp.]|nr:hypothetical protein [Rubrivivax sp.]